MPRKYNIRADIQLPALTAVWVLGAHLFALLVPLALLLAIYQHQEFVAAHSAYPVLLYVAAGTMMAGSAFEIAQNTIDRWYLTPETGSAAGTGFCDFMFFWLIVLSQALIMIACQGRYLSVTLLGVVGVMVFPILYVRQLAQFAPLAVLGLGAAISAYLSFSDPVIFLQLLLSPLTLVFFGCLLQSGNQVLHGFTTVTASSGVLFLAWGMHGGATAAPQSWTLVAAIVVITLAIMLPLRGKLAALPATPRPQLLGGSIG